MRLADRLRLAADEALVTGAPLALVWDERGYRFLAWDAGAATGGRRGSALLGRRTPCPRAAARRADGDGRAGLIAPDLPQPPVVLRIAGARRRVAGRLRRLRRRGGAARSDPDMRARADAGFTLIESLVALAILAVSRGLAARRRPRRTSRASTALEARALAQIAAENRLAEIELGLGDRAGAGRRCSAAPSGSPPSAAPTADPELARIDLDGHRARARRGAARLRRVRRRPGARVTPAAASGWSGARWPRRGLGRLGGGAAALALRRRERPAAAAGAAPGRAGARGGLARPDPGPVALRPARRPRRRRRRPARPSSGSPCMGVVIADAPEASSAIVSGPSEPARAYAVGQEIAHGATLAEVHGDQVVLEVDGPPRDPVLPGERAAVSDRRGRWARRAARAGGRARARGRPRGARRRRARPTRSSPGYRERMQRRSRRRCSTISASTATEAATPSARTPAEAVRGPGCRPGDVVAKVNGQQVGNIEADRELFDEVTASGRARIEVVRNGQPIVLSFPLR